MMHKLCSHLCNRQRHISVGYKTAYVYNIHNIHHIHTMLVYCIITPCDYINEIISRKLVEVNAVIYFVNFCKSQE